ncbi:tetratricopeptide repeat protein 4 [Hyla sarda]|uniref:tetratricopeptide repeat protein 4 n=1 Tax=Hyla sarda TaxID=327740 RepID=UPI0024C3ED1D|nr:tetratricopeptide repeat protein 4 [Hyla sarda]XP_056388162.1 tetratricopeptide repeat protein 4 [Hyla sarda]
MDPKQPEEDEVMDQFMDKFRTQKYKGAFDEDSWEQEFEKIPMFMKKAPDEINPEKTPELACLQSILFDSDRSPEEQAKSYKEEGNEYFKEKNYKKAIIAYTEGIKRNCKDAELNAVLYTNRAAAQFYLGNYRSSLNDAVTARKQKPDHLKAVIRGALCCMEIKNYAEAVKWCDEGLKISPAEKKLLETRTKADKLHRAAERDARKLKQAEKKKQAEKDSLLRAIKDRGIKILEQSNKKEDDDEEEEETSGPLQNGSENVTGAQVFIDENGRLHWPVLFFYPEHSQTDFISAFHEESRFIDHLNEMFSQDLPPWDEERKYLVHDLEVFFEDETSQSFYQVNPESTLLQVLQHSRFCVKAGTPSFLIFVKQSPFCKKYFSDKKLHRIH